ncbi:MAG: DPP IV N-terminal domain-containing protein [Planctomycetota bacterium]
MNRSMPIRLAILFALYSQASIAILVAQTEENPGEPQLAYITKRDGNFEIYRCNVRGENHVRLTDHSPMDWNPQWNEKLNGIVYYTYDQAERFQVRLMDLSGKQIKFTSPRADGFVMSPNGKYIAFTKKVGESTHLFTRATQGKDEIQLTTKGKYNGRFKWSPNSSSLAFISDRSGNNDVFEIDLKTRQVAQVTNSKEREKYIAWSPDGEQIAFTRQPDKGTEDIYVFDRAMKTETRVTDNDVADVELDWSPCGQWIAFHSTRDGGDHIYVIQPDGRNETKLTSVDAYHGEPNFIYSETRKTND